MKLAVIIERYDPLAGGNERSTDEIVRELALRGHEVTVLCGSASEEAMEALSIADETGDASLGPVQFDVMSTRRSSSVWRLLRLRRWLETKVWQGGFDASIAMVPTLPATVIEPRGGTVRETLRRNLAARPPGLPRLAATVGQWFNVKRQTQRVLEKRTVTDPRVERFVALSDYVRRQLVEGFGVADERITVIPNGAVVEPVDDATRAELREVYRRAYGVGDDQTLMLFAATNPRLKGFRTLLRALQRMEEQGLDAVGPAVVLLAGKVSDAMHREAGWRGVRHRVRWVGPTRNVNQLHAAADVVVLPSFYDPSSKVVLEALLSGTPAISTRYNGASDFIDGRYPPRGDDAARAALRGRVIDDPADADALARAMAELCDPDERQRCRDAIGDPAAIAAELSMTTHVDRLEAVLREAAG